MRRTTTEKKEASNRIVKTISKSTKDSEMKSLIKNDPITSKEIKIYKDDISKNGRFVSSTISNYDDEYNNYLI